VSRESARDYLANLAFRVARGLESLPEAYLSKQCCYILDAAQQDGGFCGRGRRSDLYYTSFALRCAEVLGIEDVALWRGAGRYLREGVGPPETVVDCFSILHGMYLIGSQLKAESFLEGGEAQRTAIESMLRGCATPQGGVAVVPGGEASVYHTFLAALCHQLLGRPTPGAQGAMAFVLACRRDDGGFVDKSDAAERGGTNPTAAAIAFLVMHDALDDSIADRAVDFLVAMQRAEGGCAAHRNAPIADLMSTFTSLVTLAELGALRRMKLAAVGRYVQGLAASEGGFHGTAVDDGFDPEYTYYGLGALGILGRAAACAGPRTRQRGAIRRSQKPGREMSWT